MGAQEGRRPTTVIPAYPCPFCFLLSQKLSFIHLTTGGTARIHVGIYQAPYWKWGSYYTHNNPTEPANMHDMPPDNISDWVTLGCMPTGALYEWCYHDHDRGHRDMVLLERMFRKDEVLFWAHKLRHLREREIRRPGKSYRSEGLSPGTCAGHRRTIASAERLWKMTNADLGPPIGLCGIIPTWTT